MNKNNVITLRLSDEELDWLGALSRRSKRSKSEIIRSLIMNGTVRERITSEHLFIIRQLIGESTNLNQLARKANSGYLFSLEEECKKAVAKISELIRQIKYDG